MMTEENTNFDPETGARDMIDLSGERPAETGAEAPDGDMSEVTQKIVTALKTVYDPEIPVDIYELGLIYKVDYEEPGDVKVVMSLTAKSTKNSGISSTS